MRYVKKTSVAEDGTESEKYVVDNSCYADDFNDDENEKTFYRHVQYTLSTDVADMNELYIATYANRIATLDGGKYTLVQKEFTALKDIAFASTPSVSGGNIDIQNVKYALEDGTYENSDVFYITDSPITKDSMLRTLGEGETASGTAYLRTHKGTSATVLQIVAYMSVVELQNADGLLDSLTVGDVVDTDKPGTSKAIIALKDCKITEIGTKINTLKIDELIDINDESARIMQSLAARGCTLDDLATIADSLTIGEVMDIEYDAYVASASGAYVQDTVFVAYNKYAHDLSEYTLYQKPQAAISRSIPARLKTVANITSQSRDSAYTIPIPTQDLQDIIFPPKVRPLSRFNKWQKEATLSKTSAANSTRCISTNSCASKRATACL